MAVPAHHAVSTTRLNISPCRHPRARLPSQSGEARPISTLFSSRRLTPAHTDLQLFDRPDLVLDAAPMVHFSGEKTPFQGPLIADFVSPIPEKTLSNFQSSNFEFSRSTTLSRDITHLSQPREGFVSVAISISDHAR